MAGSLSLLAGAAAIVGSLVVWAQAETVASLVEVEARQRLAVGGVTLVILGVQAMLSGFLLHLVSSQHASAPPRTAPPQTADR